MVLFEACFLFPRLTKRRRSTTRRADQPYVPVLSEAANGGANGVRNRNWARRRTKRSLLKKGAEPCCFICGRIDLSTYGILWTYPHPLSLSFEPLKVSLASVYPSQALLQSWSSVTVDDLKVATWRDSKRLVSSFPLEVLSFRLMFGSRITHWKWMDTMDIPLFMSFMICIMMFLNMWLWGFGHIQCTGQSFFAQKLQGKLICNGHMKCMKPRDEMQSFPVLGLQGAKSCNFRRSVNIICI